MWSDDVAGPFTDLSTGAPASWSWSWDFGDGAQSDEPHPAHTYTAPGRCDVTLEVTDGSQTSALTRTQYVVVLGAAPHPPRAAHGPRFVTKSPLGILLAGG